METDNITRPLKRSLSGLEIEVQTLDKNGYISNNADKIINECGRRKKGISIIEESTNNIVEICSYPSVKVQNTILSAMEALQTIIEIADKHDMIIYPLSVYPGSFKPEFIKSKYYQFKGKYIHDPKIPFLETRRTAFHFHYTLPRGVFDHKKKFLKLQMAAKLKQTLIDSYNMAIAMDPALITLFQSSPLYDGKYLVKDSGALFQRTGKYTPFKNLSIYNKHPTFGGLPIYKQTVSDLIYTINRRYSKIKEIVKENELDPSILKLKRIIDWAWHAVRINKLGTLEQRTMDMNHPKYVIAGAVLMKYIQRRIHQEFLRILPSDIGMREPFKQEGNIVHVPPHSYVRKKLQYWSICEGFESKEIRNYTKRLFMFGKRCTPPKFYNAIRPLENMINRKKSVSDVILRKIKRMGYDIDEKIPNDVCAKIALSSCKQLYKEIEKTKKTIVDVE